MSSIFENVILLIIIRNFNCKNHFNELEQQHTLDHEDIDNIGDISVNDDEKKF